MPARPRPPSASCTTRARTIASARWTMAKRRWISCSRSRTAASPSRAPRPPASGKATRSTSSILRDMWTSPPRWSVRCACLTAASSSSARSAASSPRRKRSGDRPRPTRSPASGSSTRWTAWAPISTTSCPRSKPSSAPIRFRSTSLWGPKADFPASSTCSPCNTSPSTRATTARRCARTRFRQTCRKRPTSGGRS